MSRYLLKKKDIDDLSEVVVQHQFNDNAIRHTKTLSKLAGLERLGLHIVRIEPGRDSTTHHSHEADEEFIYILSGQGSAQIEDERFAVEAGDFMAFPAPGPSHSLHNDSTEDLVYFVGGESNLPDVVHYPEQAKSMIKTESHRRWWLWKDQQDTPPRP